MSDLQYPVWTGDEWRELPVASMGHEALVVPNVNALVYRTADRAEVLLQRRDKPGEAVRGRWELPGGRWRAGEPAVVAVAREVLEETGIVLTSVGAAEEMRECEPQVSFAVVRPLAVVNGLEGAYPSAHVLFECVGDGTPRPQEGETADPRWWTLDEVRRALATRPEEFVWHTRVMLEAALGA
jgi:8-oxo-dGTP diphosphatase